MSNKRKLPKDKETTDYTVQDFVDEQVDKFGAFLEKVIDDANAKGLHGVMVIATETAYECDLVPYGKVFRAGSQEAVDKLRAKTEQEK